jgi:tetratricopeptide (TPR) repeat protein
MPARRSPRPSPRRDARRASKVGSTTIGRSPTRWILLAVSILAIALIASGLAWDRDRPRRLFEQAEAATLARDWPRALAAWEGFNQTNSATARTLLAEARASLALDRSSHANRALERALEADPTLLEAWRTRLDWLRVVDRPLEALRVGKLAESAVEPGSRPTILALTTLAALAELPDDEARDRLDRWIAADPDDIDARVARLARLAANFHPGDPDRAARIADLTEILARNPGHVAAREALVVALADAGEPDRGREVLEGWPETSRDARFDRLRGRWDLDYDHNPARAAESYARALIDLPHDWKSHYGLARAYRALGRDAEARSEAEAVARIRERLDPRTLGPRLADALAKLDDPRALLDLSSLCEGVGLAHLAESWRREATH